MQLIGQAIRHETFGKGIVTGWNRNILTVCFPGGDKRFLYPDAFARRHLTLRNQGMQECPAPDSSAKLFLAVIWSLMVTGMPWRSSTSCWIMLLTSCTSENSPW